MTTRTVQVEEYLRDHPASSEREISRGLGGVEVASSLYSLYRDNIIRSLHHPWARCYYYAHILTPRDPDHYGDLDADMYLSRYERESDRRRPRCQSTTA